MSLIMQPMLSEGGFAMMNGERAGTRPSFSSHFDRQLKEIVSRNIDKLGVSSRKEELAGNDKEKLASLLQIESDELAENEKAAAILSFFLQDLRSVARQKELGPGEWEAAITDREALKKLALDAGMTGGRLGAIVDKMGGKNADLNVASVLESLGRHLSNVEEGRITVPETRLPFLESLLSKMGLDSSLIKEIAAAAVTGDNQLNLIEFFRGLRDIDLESAELSGDKGGIKLSEWEIRQLYDFLAEAGVDRSLRNKLLPELNLKNLFNHSAGKDSVSEFSFNLERLKEILKSGIENVRNQQPEIKIGKFVVDLEKVLGHAEFNDKSAGWSKVIQEAVDSLFRDIQKMVDMSRVQVQKAGEIEDELLLNGLLRQSRGKGRIYLDKWPYDSKETSAVSSSDKKAGRVKQKLEFWMDVLAASSKNDSLQRFRTGDSEASFPGQMAKADNQSYLQILQNGRIMGRSPQQIQEHIMQQISSGVMRGLENRQHSLVLRLHPPEMGEVKVNLQVRNDHVSVIFNMESSRVKEILEGNMQNFKDSMGQKGFLLEECSVSVGQEGASKDKEQFEKFFKAGTGRGEAIAEEEYLPDAAYYTAAAVSGSGNEKDGISLVV
ncbi:MAG: flagellar hook-length control protein FliK [Thermodesulfobacteriota bacterium]